MVTVRSTSQSKHHAVKARPGTSGTACPSGWMISGQVNCFRSPSAGNAPGRGSAPGRLTWITLWTTKATGHYSPTGVICKACVIAAIAERQCRNAGNSAETERFSVPELGTIGRSFGRGRGSGVRLRGSSRHPPGVPKFLTPPKRPQPTLRAGKSPHQKIVGARKEMN